MNLPRRPFLFLSGILVVLAATQVAVRAQDSAPPAESVSGPKATVEDLKWIAGHWQGEALGGRFEETWNPPLGDSMIGMFKLLNGEQTQFCELLMILPKQDSLVLRLKHFSGELVGWEEKDKYVEFPLVRVSDRVAEFAGLTFTRMNQDAMHITVMVEREGEHSELKFECHRVKK